MFSRTPPTEKKPAKEELLHAAFGTVPLETLTKIAAVASSTDPTVRGLLLSLLSEPRDKVCWAAVIDYASEFISRPDEVEFRGRRIPTSQEMDYSWWFSALDRVIAQALLRHIGKMTVGGYNSAAFKTLSLDRLCTQSPDELLRFGEIKEKRLKKIQLFLGSIGLHLFNDAVHLPPEQEKEGIDDDGSSTPASDTP